MSAKQREKAQLMARYMRRRDWHGRFVEEVCPECEEQQRAKDTVEKLIKEEMKAFLKPGLTATETQIREMEMAFEAREKEIFKKAVHKAAIELIRDIYKKLIEHE